MLLIIPTRNLVVVRQGDAPGCATLGGDLLAGTLGESARR